VEASSSSSCYDINPTPPIEAINQTLVQALIYNKQLSAEITVNTSLNRTHRRQKVHLTTQGNIKFVSVDATVLLPPDVYEQGSLNTQN